MTDSNFLRQTLAAVKPLFELKKTQRLWHIPFLAALSTGIPLFLGLAIGRVDFGLLGCIGALVILYMPPTATGHRLVTLTMCAFGFISSFALGLFASWHPAVAALMVGMLAFFATWAANFYKLQVPRNFFFIMLASMAACMPFDLVTLPTKVGLVALGSIIACSLALVYTILTIEKYPAQQLTVNWKPKAENTTESLIFAVCIAVSLGLGLTLKLDNPYWLPISTLAIMQSVSVSHAWQRSIHRIAGTFLGMLLTWLLLSFNPNAWQICALIVGLQFLVEFFIVRNYGIAVFFLTPMTVFLADMSRSLNSNHHALIYSRLTDIAVGSAVGLVGGLLLYNEYLRSGAQRQVIRTKLLLKKKQTGVK